MRLLSHNVLRNTHKDAVEGYPLKIEAVKVDVSVVSGLEWSVGGMDLDGVGWMCKTRQNPSEEPRQQGIEKARMLATDLLKLAQEVQDSSPNRLPPPIHHTPQCQVRDSECDLTFLRHLLPSLSWKGLKSAAEDLGLDASVLPDEVRASNGWIARVRSRKRK